MAGQIAPSPKLLSLVKDFQNIASMAGYLNHSVDAPQLRMLFTLFGRMVVASQEEGLALTPRLQAWSEALSLRLREDSSSVIMPPQIVLGAPQLLPNGESWYIVSTISFHTKVTEHSYLRVRTAILNAYQAAVELREKGFSD